MGRRGGCREVSSADHSRGNSEKRDAMFEGQGCDQNTGPERDTVWSPKNYGKRV